MFLAEQEPKSESAVPPRNALTLSSAKLLLSAKSSDQRWFGPWGRAIGARVPLFSPLRGCEAAMLEEGVGDHCHQGVPVKSLPGASLEVIKPKLFLELLMGRPAHRSIAF